MDLADSMTDLNLTGTKKKVVTAGVDLARDIAINGIGEGEKAHGIAIALCNGAKMMKKDTQDLRVQISI